MTYGGGSVSEITVVVCEIILDSQFIFFFQVSICVNDGLMDGKENYDSDLDPTDIMSDSLLYPRVSDQFPQRVTRSRLQESLAKIWHSVSTY